MVLLFLSAGGAGAEPRPAQTAQHFAQLIVRERIVIRSRARAAIPQPIEWKEGKGPKCIGAKQIAGAALLSTNSVDLMLRTGQRLRAKLERSCPALDYYQGFYISPGTDGRICADRDAIRSRVGGQCGIDAFRALTPKKPKK